jgi:16S rRNA (cytosine967-C5)-methyltransferase
LLAALNTESGILLRARGDIPALLSELAAEGVNATALGLGTAGIRVEGVSHQIFDTKPFKAGRLQVQDLGSQLIGLLCKPGSGWEGARVMDVCAGAGGKTLLLADQVGPKGRVDAADSSKKRLAEARRRAGELRLSNVVFPEPLQLEKADAVLIDAPCSGTGSLAREPDQKWRLTEKGVAEWVATQAEILGKTAAAMRPGAVLVYATCSLLPAENEAQVERFLAAHPEWVLEPAAETLPDAAQALRGPYLRPLPHRVPGGAFFAARLRKS